VALSGHDIPEPALGWHCATVIGLQF